MNAIVPTAAASQHTDRTLAANSAKTAERAKNVLRCLRGSLNVIRNCAAVHAAAAAGEGEKKVDDDSDDALVSFWSGLFEESEFTKRQREDIADAFSDLI